MELSSIATSVVRIALDALSQRQQLIATNLANANSLGYVAQDIRFEDVLQQALNSEDGSVTDRALRDLATEISDGSRVAGRTAGAVKLDSEMVQLNETVIRYQALIQGLGKYSSLKSMAILGEVKG
jgi:flagellar basal-body rod protein FlgB